MPYPVPTLHDSDAALATPRHPELGRLPEWDLSDLYASMDAEALHRDLTDGLKRAKAFEKSHAGRIAERLGEGDGAGGDALAAIIADYEALEDLLGRVISYAGLVYAGDSASPAKAKFYGDVQEKMTVAGRHLLFFPLEVNRLDEEAVERAIEASGKLAHYGPWIRDLRLDKPYQLDDRIERLFLEKSATGRAAFNRLFDETMSALRFEVRTDSGIEEWPIEPTLNLLQDADRKKRRQAAEALATTFNDNLRLFTLITNTLAKDKQIGDEWRGFEDVADARHLANRVEREVVEALVEAVREAYPRLSHRYYAMKAKWLNLDHLMHYDRNAPLPDVPQRTIGWEEARETVLSAYRGFAPRMADIAGDFFAKSWIDAPVRPGKSPGAFAHPTVPSAHPYVLLNYQGKPRDVMTLAHELGHGVHQVLAADQGALMAQTPLTLAETASVFGEMLTFRSLIDATDAPAQRRAMLAAKVEDMLNTVVRQIAFYSFERRIHEGRRGGELTAEAIGDIWLEVQKESLGPAIRFGPGYETFWTYVPHFVHSPFYVYAYAFGDCLVNSLYAVYREGETGFEDRYFAMLAAGGSKHHSELLAPFGLDASDPDFWQKGLGVIEGMIDEIERTDAGS